MASEQSSQSQSSFLHSSCRPGTELKSVRLRREMYKLTEVDTVFIYREKESPEIINYRVCDFGDEKLFSAVQVLQPKQPEEEHVGMGKKITPKGSSRESFQYLGRHDSQRQSFQYLVRRFDRNDPLVVKPRDGSVVPEFEIHCSDGNVVGYCALRSDSSKTVCDISDSTDTTLYTLTSSKSGCCGCCSFFMKSRRKTDVYKVVIPGEKDTLVEVSIPRKEKDKPMVITFPSDLDEVYKVLFLGSTLTLDADNI